MTVLAVIPARGGSKGIPRKNLAILAGQPLISYSIKAALQSQYVHRTIVSTDDQTIADVALECGAEVPFLRPTDLAGDLTPMFEVLSHVLDWFEKSYDKLTALVLLQPTSPLREAVHIDEAIRLFLSNSVSSVVSVREVPHQYSPVSVMSMKDNRLEPFLPEYKKVLRRQDKPVLYARNGPAVLVMKPGTIRSGDLYGDNCAPYLMSETDSHDIDTQADLEYIEWLMERRRIMEDKTCIAV